MAASSDSRPLGFAARHLGVITASEASFAGWTEDQRRHRVASGVLHRPAPGVFVAAGAPDTPQQRIYLACRAGAGRAVASHLSAAALFGLASFPLLPHVTVPAAASARSRLAAVHRSDLDAADVTRLGLIPCTTPARTLVDCAGAVAPKVLQELVDAMLVRGLTTYDDVGAATARATRRPGRKGIPALREAIAPWARGIVHDSVPEARMFRLIESWGFPRPVALHRVLAADGTFVAEVDAAWPERRVALEYEGQLAHCPSRFEHDERRYDHVRRLGWVVVPVTKDDLLPGHHARFRSLLERVLDRPVRGPVQEAG